MILEHPRAGDADGVPPATVDVNGETVPVADDGTFEIPDEAAGWAERFANRYNTTADAVRVTPDDIDGPSGTFPFDPSSQTVDELREHLQDVDDPEAVRAIRDEEERNDDRTTAINAIEKRLDELEGEE